MLIEHTELRLHQEHTAGSVLLNEEMIETSSIKARQRCPHLPNYFRVANTIRQKKMIKGVKFRKEVKLSPFADDILVCLKKIFNQ